MYYVERIATESVSILQEYLLVRHAAERWQETLETLGGFKQARHVGPLRGC